ncbi:Stk1 family PASTA domain-containing Ser/Thr kinase [Paenarthrobacter sp. PH39-S1]|uniref:Stk1 family PASTA domain-containing Ser/Thr kinase n=1 Tax=Paenarthrobacter sp. PH39-S1 TaxID=3046204 RepID=UPI0024BBCAFD|nr:Stk1 family PASTA domain-containing Ser/Thr kinase [Paenarthrobacter sp. PH39-S1]MDJ0355754.1 Stk1 family PASTA domain-containing Ser/Thr kinase [Paenarthrobacter sp. PH39-S1]
MNIPRVLNGRYELGRLLGRGGMADVYMGRDTRLGRTVAVKLLRADLARDPQLQARFRREAQAVAGLNHPSIVAVYDTGDHSVGDPLSDGTRMPFIVMEYVSGRTLRDLVRSKELSIDHAIDYTLGVLSALEYSHRAGIVHRDIKPANVMVTQDGNAVKVMDFGIARAIADSSATMTQTQAVIGTAQYLSPEQARGETVDERSDLYSAACLFYELLTGRPPFMGDSPVSVAYQHVRETPEAPSYFNSLVSPALDSVVLRALEKNRADRFQNAAAFRRALRAAKGGVQLSPFSASEAPTEMYGLQPAHTPPAVTAVSSVPRPAAADHPHDGGPSTRAMAKVLAGGPLTTGDAPDEDPDALPLGLPAEKERDRTSKRRRRAWIVTLFVLLALMLAGGGVLAYGLFNAKPAATVQIQIPTVRTMAETDAMAKLYSDDLRPTLQRRYDEALPKGQAIGTDPTAGQRVDPRSSIKLIISDGPSTVQIPSSLVNVTEATARDAIKALGLLPGETKQVNDGTIGAGLVVTTSPSPGQVAAAGSKVDLMVSTGKVTMPSLFGFTQAEAEQAVKNASGTLQMAFVEKENSVVEAGKVTNQSADAGSSVDQFSTITVEIASAPAPPPLPTSTPTPTPTASATPSDCASKKNKDCTASGAPKG